MSESPTEAPPLARVRRRGGAVFAAVFLSVLALLHGVVWWRLVHGIGLPPVAEAASVGVFATGAALLLAAFQRRFSNVPTPAWLAAAGYGWLGVVFLAFTATILTEPARWLLPLAGVRGAAPELSGATGLAIAGLTGWGFWRTRRPEVTRTRVPVRGLDPALAGFRIVQISDVHVGNTVGRAFVERIVEAVEATDADLVAITGDLVDGTPDELADAVAPLARLKSRHGTYFVTGNHEYYAGGPAWVAHLETLGVRVLRNERVRVHRDGRGFDLVGVDDLFGRMAPGHGFDLDRALAGRDESVPAVLLSHQPVTVERAADRGVALQLSGHTHGGQIWPWHHLVRLQQPYLAGLVSHRGTMLYVHRGTGYWGPPMRIGAPAEIAVLELVPA